MNNSQKKDLSYSIPKSTTVRSKINVLGSEERDLIKSIIKETEYLSIIVDEVENLRYIKVLSIVVSYYSFVEEKQIYLLIGLEEIEEVNGKNVAELIMKVIGKDGYDIEEEQLLGLITDCASYMGTTHWVA